jgi:phosphatidylserine/phosphatidylglycerophosphate/cardiolipin synthase-like enzyme
MHNKFLVFCNLTEGKTDEQFPDTTVPTIVPQSVWTGSFNLTKNATMSFENAVLLVGNSVAGAYFNEWAQILALSEPLDWRSEWMEPEWKVGT